MKKINLLIILLLLVTTVTAAPKLLNFEDSLANLGKLIENIGQTEYAVFIVILILLFLIIYNTLMIGVSNVPHFKNSPYIGKIVASFTLMSLVYFTTKVKTITAFIETYLGSGTTALIIMVALSTLAIRVRKGKESSFLVPGIIILIGAYLVKNQILGIIAILLIATKIFGTTKLRGSPEGRHKDSRDSRNWLNKFKDTTNDFIANRKQNIETIGKTTNYLKNILNKEEKEKETKEILDKIRELDKEQIDHLEHLLNTGNLTPKNLLDFIEKKLEYNKKIKEIYEKEKNLEEEETKIEEWENAIISKERKEDRKLIKKEIRLDLHNSDQNHLLEEEYKEIKEEKDIIRLIDHSKRLLEQIKELIKNGFENSRTTNNTLQRLYELEKAKASGKTVTKKEIETEINKLKRIEEERFSLDNELFKIKAKLYHILQKREEEEEEELRKKREDIGNELSEDKLVEGEETLLEKDF